MEKFFVYILYSKAIDRYYIGHTSNLEHRLQNHLLGSTRFTSQTNDWELIYSEEYATKGEAMKRESQIKRMKSRKFIEELTGHAGGRPD